MLKYEKLIAISKLVDKAHDLCDDVIECQGGGYNMTEVKGALAICLMKLDGIYMMQYHVEEMERRNRGE